jgi:hypothetical protein
MVAEFNWKYRVDMLCRAHEMKKGGCNSGFDDNKLVTFFCYRLLLLHIERYFNPR